MKKLIVYLMLFLMTAPVVVGAVAAAVTAAWYPDLTLGSTKQAAENRVAALDQQERWRSIPAQNHPTAEKTSASTQGPPASQVKRE